MYNRGNFYNSQYSSRKYFESYPIWGESSASVTLHYANKNRDRVWYSVAYKNLANYYAKLQTYDGNEKKTLQLMYLIGYVFNCMCNKIARNATESDIEHIFDVLTSPRSELRRYGGLSGEAMNRMYHIFDDWVFRIKKTNGYFENQSSSDYSSTTPTYSPTPSKQQYLDSYSFRTPTYGTRSDMEVATMHCNKMNKHSKWYEDGYFLIVKIYNRIRKNLVPQNIGYTAIGYLFNCLLNKKNSDPSDMYLQAIYNILNNPRSWFWTESNLGKYRNNMLIILNEWFTMHGQHIQKPINSEQNRYTRYKNFQWSWKPSANDRYPMGQGQGQSYSQQNRSENAFNNNGSTFNPRNNGGRSGNTFNPGNYGNRSGNTFNPGNNWSRSGNTFNPGNYGNRSGNAFNPGNSGSRSGNTFNTGNNGTRSGNTFNTGNDGSRRGGVSSDNNRDVTYYDRQRDSYCNTTNRDKKWYLDTFRIIEQLDKFTDVLFRQRETTELKRGKTVILMFLNCMINNSNANPSEQKTDLRKIQKALSVTSSNKKADGTMRHSTSLNDFLTKSELEFDPYIIKLQKIFENTKLDS